MNKYTFLVAFLCSMCPIFLSAQIQKGGNFLSMNLGFSKSGSKSEDSNNTPSTGSSGGFNTSFAYERMVTNRWAIGGGFGWSTHRGTSTFTTYSAPIETIDLKSKNNDFSLKMTSHYFYPLGTSGKWLASVGSEIGYRTGQGHLDTIRATGVSPRTFDRTQTITLSIAPSIVFAFSKHFLAQAYIGSLGFGYGGTKDNKRKDFVLSIYPSWGSFGFLYYW